MIVLLGLYAWTLGGAVAFAPVLSLVGAQLATRDRGMQVLCVSQGAMFGVLLGISFLGSTPWVLLPSLMVGGLSYWLTAVFASYGPRSTAALTVLALFMGGCHLLAALLPGLETHLSRVYFGDMATLSEWQSQCLLGGALLAGLFLAWRLRDFTNGSFEAAVFGRSRTSEWGFTSLTLLALCLGVQYVGLLFTLSCLFIPTTLVAMGARPGLRRHYLGCIFVSIAGVAGGFVLSLAVPRMPTVPTVTLSLLFAGVAWLGLDRVLSWGRSWAEDWQPELQEGENQ